MKTKTSCIFLVVLITLGTSTHLLAQGPGMIREFYACNYFEGKNQEDLMSATENLVEQMDAMGLDSHGATYLWTPNKTNGIFDFLWFNEYRNMNEFGRDADVYSNSPLGAAAQARFDHIVDCVTGLVTHQQIWDGGSLQVTGQAVVSSAACQLKPGATLPQVAQVVGQFTELLEDLGTHSENTAFMQTPIISSSGMDVYFFSVFNDFTTYAAAETAVASSSDGPAIGQRFNELVHCDTSLWNGQVIIPATY